ncbi:MAG: glycosyltransferase family 2 protein [Desulfobacteraceae bacterium]|nr:glycosyltransferase family 2 protein [Desulfobacteraceae bacterium]
MRNSLPQERSRGPLVVLIPALNEASTIGRVVGEVKAELDCEVVVIDDASTDRTAEEARIAGATVLPLRLPLGAWGAIRTGMCYAFKHGYHVAVTMDGDGQHLASSIQSVIKPIESEHADVVIGACVERGNLARRVAWAVLRKLTSLRVEDLTSGLRAYNRAAISELTSSDTTLFDYQDIVVLVYLQKGGLKIAETPVEMCSRISGHSRIFHSWVAVLRYLLVTSVLCLSRPKFMP